MSGAVLRIVMIYDMTDHQIIATNASISKEPASNIRLELIQVGDKFKTLKIY